MQYRPLPMAFAAALALASGFAQAADPSKPAGSQPSATAPAATTAKPAATKAAKPARKPKPVDINSASAEQLKTVPGVDDAQAEKIIKNRPYPTRAYLVTKEVFRQDDYYKVKDYFVAAPPAEPKANAKK